MKNKTQYRKFTVKIYYGNMMPMKMVVESITEEGALHLVKEELKMAYGSELAEKHELIIEYK